MTVLFSNNGKLIQPSAHLERASDGTNRENDPARVRIPSTAYEPVRRGGAISAYFLRAYHPAIKLRIDENDRARFMLLSQIRPAHAVQQPPVLINYHEDLTGQPYKDIPSDADLDIDFSGAAYYGNRMFYYQNAFKESEFNVTLTWKTASRKRWNFRRDHRIRETTFSFGLRTIFCRRGYCPGPVRKAQRPH
jgi:hypothetical protein